MRVIVSQFWKLEVQNQGVHGAVLLLRHWIKSFLASSWLLVVAVQPWCSLPHSSLCLSDRVAISLCVCLHLDIFPLLKRTLVIMD